jgi:CubicO group peptidase (beta-lactamase class C family)
MMLARGDGAVLDPKTFNKMTKPRPVPRGTRTYGWDHRSPYSSNRGESFSDAAVGHGGFTGTVIWIDPELERVFIFLSNRLHPDGKGTVNRLAGKIATLVGTLEVD